MMALEVAGVVLLLAALILLAALKHAERHQREKKRWWDYMEAELDEMLRETDEERTD